MKDLIKEIFGDDLLDMVRQREVERVQQSYVLQDKTEQMRRLDLVIRMSAELMRIREVSLFATRIGEMVIEAVMEGDLDSLKVWRGHFTFHTEGEELRALWEKFNALVEEAWQSSTAGMVSTEKH